MPVDVINTSGHVTPFSHERLVGSLVLSGLDRETAIERANIVRVIAQASGVDVITTDALRHVANELASAESPDFSRLANILRREPLEVLPVVEPVPLDLTDANANEIVWHMVEVLGEPERLPSKVSSPLAELLRLSAGVCPPLTDPELGELGAALRGFADTLRQASAFANNQGEFQAWIGPIGKAARRLAVACQAVRSEPATAAGLVKRLAEVFEELRVPLLAPEITDWQFPVIAAIGAIPTSAGIDMPSFINTLKLAAIRRDCPPCPAECPHLASTTYETVTLTNPRNCSVTVDKVDWKIKKVGISWWIWERTCTWDALVEYKRVNACFNNRVAKFLGTLICCASTYEWRVSEQREYTQKIVQRSNVMPTWPNQVDYDKPLPRSKAKGIPQPPDADKTF